MYASSPRLIMWKNGEIFCGPAGMGRVRLPLFYLTNSLLGVVNILSQYENLTIMDGLRTWVEFLLSISKEGEINLDNNEDIPEDVKDDLVNFKNQRQQYIDGKMEKPIPSSLSAPGKIFTYDYEIKVLKSTLVDWLQPSGKGKAGRRGRKTPSQKYSEDYKLLASMFEDNMADKIKNKYPEETIFNKVSLYACVGKWFNDLPIDQQRIIERYELLIERNTQFHTNTIAVNIDKNIIKAKFDTIKVKDRISTSTQYKTIAEKWVATECYISNQGFLPLVWAEILYAVRNDIFAQECPVCHRWFPITDGKYSSKYCSPKCRSKAKRIDQQKKRSARIKR